MNKNVEELRTILKEYNLNEPAYKGLIDIEVLKGVLDEVDRLNNIIKQQDTRNSKQRIANRKLLERNQDLVIENLKLNNIINELEKWLISEIKRLEDIQNPKKGIKPYGQEYDNYTLLIDAYDRSLDKLQELKGSDK